MSSMGERGENWVAAVGCDGRGCGGRSRGGARSDSATGSSWAVEHNCRSKSGRHFRCASGRERRPGTQAARTKLAGMRGGRPWKEPCPKEKGPEHVATFPVVSLRQQHLPRQGQRRAATPHSAANYCSSCSARTQPRGPSCRRPAVMRAGRYEFYSSSILSQACSLKRTARSRHTCKRATMPSFSRTNRTGKSQVVSHEVAREPLKPRFSSARDKSRP